MGIEKVKEKVEQESQEQAKSQTDAAKAQARQILSTAQKEANAREKAFVEQLAAETDLVKKREAASAALEAKKLLLNSRKEIVDDVFDQAREHVANLTDAQRAAHIKKLLRKAESEIDIGVVICNRKDAKHISGYTVHEAPIFGGIIAESSDGTLRVDYSYETLFEQLRDSLLPDLNTLLFEK